MNFELLHKKFFDAKEGSFSRVTERENHDSQITLTDIETHLVNKYFGSEGIHTGNVASNKEAAQKDFLLYPTFRNIALNLVFPKPLKSELRLYLSERMGFKPKGGEIWFLFINSIDQLVIGSMEENIWNNLGQLDEEDDTYQNSIEEVSDNIILPRSFSLEGKIVQRTINSKTIYVRDSKLAALRFRTCNFQCEINPSHQTFITQRTNLPYLEAHHLLPMQFQSNYNQPLDNFYNIIALCPNCHRAFHHAVIDHKYELIKKIYETRPELHNFSLKEITDLYNCITIPNK